MKAILEFDLTPGSDDHYDWETHKRAAGYRRVIEDLDNKLRKLSKYEDCNWATEARAMLAELMSEYCE